MRPSSPNSASKQTSLSTINICKIHKQPFSMICLHTGCHSCYKLICVKCKKQKHYQHPNRVINLVDFYNMLGTNKMDFIENSLGLFLVNIKNKLIYVSNFRIFILEKQSMLIQNARSIHATIFKIHQEKQLIKAHIENINDEAQLQNTDKLSFSLEEIKKFISFNPIQNVLKVNSQKVGSLKVELQKYCDATKSVINDIRQYLVKIVEVMIEQELDDDDIEYIEHEDVDEKVFNINVKKLNHVEMNEKQARYKVEDLQEMFNSLLKFEIQKHEQNVENDVQKLEEEIKIKQEIVHKIRKRSTSKFMKNFSQSDQIKQTNPSPGKNTGSQYNSSIGHNDYQTDKEFQKINLETPKIKDGRSHQQQRNITKNINRNIQIPKVKSITDKANMSPKASNSGVKVGGLNIPNKKSPITIPKSGNQTSKSQIKHKNQPTKDLISNFVNEESDQKNQNSQNQTNLSCQQIDEREGDLSLNMEKSFASSVQRQTPEKSQQRQNKKDPKLAQLTLNNMKLMSQKKELQVIIDKLQKEIKQLKQKQKQSNLKQQNQLNVKNFKQLPAVKKKNQDLSKRNEELNEKNEDLKMKLQEISNKNDELNKQIEESSKLQMKFKEISKKNKELNTQFQESSKKNEQLNKQFADIIKRFEDISKKNNELNKRNKDLQKKIQEMLRKNEQIIIRDQQLAGKLVEQKNIHQKEMKQKLNDLNSQKEKKINSLEQKIKELSDQNQKLRQESEQVQNSLIQKQMIISQLQSSFESQEKQLEQLQKQKSNLSAALTQNTLLISDRESKISQMELQIQENNKVLEEKQQIIQQNQEEIKSLSSLNYELSQQIKQKTLQLEANESLVRQMDVQIEQKSQQTNQAKQKLIQSEHQLQEQLKIIKDFLNSQQSAQKEIQTLNKQITAQNSTLKSSQSFIKDLQHKQTHLKQQIEELSSDQNPKVKALHQTLRQLELELNQTKTILASKQNQLCEYQKRLSETIQKIQILQIGKENLKTNYQRQLQTLKDQQQFIQQKQEQKIWAKDQQVEKLSYSNQELILQIQSLKQQIEKLQKSLLTSNQSILSWQSQTAAAKDDLEKAQKENGVLNEKLQRSEEQLQKAKSSERQRMKENQKIQAQMMQQFQFYKKKYQDQKQRNEQNKPIDTKNYIPLIKHNELKQWYEIAIRKNQQFKDEIHFLREEIKRYVQQYELKLKQVTQLNALLIEKCDNNIETQKRSTVKRQISRVSSNQSLRTNVQKSSSMQTKHFELRQIIQLVTGDMQLLEEKVKENTVIEKVYLKELDRKRTENRKLRQEIQEYRMRERKFNGFRTERNFEKVPSSKGVDTKDIKVYYTTGSAVSESKVSEGGSSLVSGKHISNFRDNFVSKSESESLRSSQSMNI